METEGIVSVEDTTVSSSWETNFHMIVRPELFFRNQLRRELLIQMFSVCYQNVIFPPFVGDPLRRGPMNTKYLLP